SETGRKDLRQPIDYVDGSVLATRATDRHGEVAAVAALVLGDTRCHELRDVVDEVGDVRLRFQEADDLRIPAGQIAQSGLPVGIGQRARIKHKVGVAGNPVFESERLERNGQPADGALLDALMDDVPQRVHTHLGGIDYQVGGVHDRLEQLPLQSHGLAQVD